MVIYSWSRLLRKCITIVMSEKSRGISKSSSAHRPWKFKLILRCSYWWQRYKLLSKYDEGVWLTDDAWFGITPESVAKFVLQTQR
jgi:hypothetical protein